MRLHPGLDLRFGKLLPDKPIAELDDQLAENLEAAACRDPRVVELIGSYATRAIFPLVRAVFECCQVGETSCAAEASFLAIAFESDSSSGGNCSAILNQYHLDTLLALKQKLAQFPAGTASAWRFHGDAPAGGAAFADVRSFLSHHGISLR